MRAGNFLPVGALLFRDHQIHRPQHGRGRVDGHRDRGFFQIDAVEEDLHVFQRIDGDAALADFAFAGRMIGVIAHQRGQIERDRQSAAAVLQQILVALVGFLRRGEAGELPHGEKLAAITAGVNAACVRRLPGIAKILLVVPVVRQIGVRVEPANRNAGNGGEASVAVLVEIGARGRADRLLGRLLQGRKESFFRPILFPRGRMPVVEHVSNRIFRDLRLGKLLLGHPHPSCSRS